MDFIELIEEIIKEVTYLEPFAAGCSRIPSSAYCLLLKMLMIRLTEKEMYNLLGFKKNPYVRCIGILYLRYTCPPDELWSWIGHYIDDPEIVRPCADQNKKMTIGEYIKQIVSGIKYYNTVLPRIPMKIETEIKANILKHELIMKKNKNNEKYRDQYEIDTPVMSLYSMDCEWYKGKIVGIRDSGTFKIKYDEYGNEEYRSIYCVELLNGNEHFNDDIIDEKEILERIKEEERTKALAKGKKYAEKVDSIKRNLTLPFDRYTSRRSHSRSRSPKRK